MEMTHDNITLGPIPIREARAAPKGLLGPVSEPLGMKLADLATGAEAHVVSVSAADTGGAGDLGRRLAELGFLPGEKIRIVARGFMGREPIAVRIGTGTFALRLFEATCVQVCPELPLDR
jgi:ferrous iron transport protein A